MQIAAVANAFIVAYSTDELPAVSNIDAKVGFDVVNGEFSPKIAR